MRKYFKQYALVILNLHNNYNCKLQLVNDTNISLHCYCYQCKNKYFNKLVGLLSQFTLLQYSFDDINSNVSIFLYLMND